MATGKALAQGINRLAKQAMNAGIKAITKRYTIKRSRVKGAIDIPRLASRGFYTVIIRAYEQTGGRQERRVPGLVNFGAKAFKRGSRVKVRVRKGQTRIINDAIIIPGAKKDREAASGFIGPSRRGFQVFEKQGFKTVPKKGRYKGRRLTRRSAKREAGQRMQRELLVKLWGPSVRGMFAGTGRKAMRKYIRQNRTRILQNSMQRFMQPTYSKVGAK